MERLDGTPDIVQTLRSSSRHTISLGVAGAVMILASVSFSFAATSAADREIPWNEDTDDPTLISMGPVGARAKTDHLQKGCADSQSSSGTVKYIFKNSPAEGKLQLEDEVVGVNGQAFNKDFSRRLGAAIDWSEGNTGKLELDIRRQGKPLKVVFDLPKIGSFSETYPYECRKSAAILEAACDWLARHQWPNGKLEGDRQSGYTVCTAAAGLAFLGSGNPKYAKNANLTATYFLNYFTINRTPDGHFKQDGLLGWQLMYGTMFLGEYYLATRDSRIPPMLAYLNKEIQRLQFQNLEPETVAALRQKFPDGAPPYWFGHGRMTLEKVMANPPAYIDLGVNVANALVAWDLIDECEVAIDRDNLKKTLDYVQIACPVGQMGYAGRPNQRGAASDAFGRTGVLAVAYQLRNDRPDFMRKIAGSLEKQYLTNYFTSHSSSVMGKAWGTLGIAGLDPKVFRKVMDHYKYDYNLIRLHDGSFVANPAHWVEEGHPQCDLKGAYGNEHRWTTAFNAFLFTLSQQRLRIAGGHPRLHVNLPGVDPEALKGRMKAAYQALGKKDFAAAASTLQNPAPEDAAVAKAIMDVLATQAQCEIATLEAIEKVGDIAQLQARLKEAQAQFGLLQSFKEKVAHFEEGFNHDAWKLELKLAAEYRRLVEALQRNKSAAYAGDLERFAERHPDSLYGKWAVEVAKEYQTSGTIKNPSATLTTALAGSGGTEPLAALSVPGGVAATSPAANGGASAVPASLVAKELPAKPTTVPARTVVSPEALAQWQARFVRKLDALAKGGAKLNVDLGDNQAYILRGADQASLVLSAQGSDLPMPWRLLSPTYRAALAKGAATDNDVEALLIAAVFHLAVGRSDEAETLFARAALKDAAAVKVAKAELAPH